MGCTTPTGAANYGVVATWVACALLAHTMAQADPPPEPVRHIPGVDGQGPRETWDVFFVQGAKVGYGQTTVTPFEEDGARWVRVELVYHLRLKRFGQTSEEELRLSSIESTTGNLRSFESKMNLGPAPIVVEAHRDGPTMHVTTTSAGNTSRAELPWSDDLGGLFAGDLTLLRQPMQPGERRTYRALLPPMNVVATFEMQAERFEPTKLLSGTFDLLRIQSTAQLPGGASLATTLWTDRKGEILRTYSDALSQDTYRVTKSQALDERGLAALDLGQDSVVRLDRPLSQPGTARQVRYRVRLTEGEAQNVFVAGGNQQVSRTADGTVELVVRAVDARTPSNAKDSPPSEDLLGPNTMIQSDDPHIVELATRAAGNQTDPLQVALQLEQFVHDSITSKNFSQAFATAAEVARTREGDCTEHAVLLAALARARGIAARVAIGLVYVPSAQGFGYHMWNELYLDGRWIPLDATTARGGVSATHLKLADSSLAGPAAYTSLLPVARVLGRLQLEVLAEE